jgi:alpha-2-macroglobulin
MRISTHYLTAALAVVFLFACNRKSITLDYTNAKDEVPQLGNLVFRFDKPLTNDSLLNSWDSTQYIIFEPHIPGRFRWEHPDELVFSPAEPLSPATTYTATLSQEILQNSPYSRISHSDGIVFHTPDLKLDNSNASWILLDDKSGAVLPQIEMHFNYPVNPNTLKEKLQVKIDGQVKSYSFQTLSTENRIAIRILDLKMEDRDYTAEINVARGLIPEKGIHGSPEPSVVRMVIPSPYALRVNDVSTDHDGVSGSIKVTTSQQVVASGLGGFIKIEPEVNFSVEAQDDGFLIHSDHFDMQKSYSLVILKGLRGRIGGTLQEEYNGNIAFGQLEPAISFGNTKGIYLSGNGEKNLEVKITNVQKIKILVSKIYENNILAAQREGYEPSETGNNNEEEPGSENAENSNGTVSGDVIFEQEVETRSLPQYGGSRIFHFNIKDKVPDFSGIYHIQIRSVKDYWVRDSRFVSLSDIGLIAKEGKDKILVFANSIGSSEALAGVNVIAYGANNQILGMAATSADGVAEIIYSKKEAAGFRPAMIIAKTASDFNYIPFATTAVNTSRFETGGKRTSSTGLDAFIYPERDIYRPGEKLNFAVIIRDKQWKSPGEIPVKLKFLLPNGKELKSFRKTLNDQGSLEGSLDLAASAITGSYSLELYSSTDILLSTQAFRIEEFVPDRIKVTTKLDKPFLVPGDSSRLSIKAVNFFGPPAANRNYECEIQVKQKSFNTRKFDKYNFTLANSNSFFDKAVRQGKTDDQGEADEEYEAKAMYRNMGLLQTDFYTTVFDETGRPVSRHTSIDIFTQPLFFGVADDGYWFYALNQPIQFPIIAVDKNEKVLEDAPARIDVVKHEYRTVLTKSGDYFRYESQEEDKLLSSNVITVKGENTIYTYVPRTPGNYELRVYIPGANSYISRSFYSYGNWGGGNASFEVNNEGHINIEPDKTSYFQGEKVKAFFKAPFNGRMLVTTEADNTLSYQYVEVKDRTATLELSLNSDDIPNMYITATLIKPHDLSDIPLTVAHGFQSIRVEAKNRKLTVEILAQRSVRSKTHQRVTIKSAPNSMVSLAAVDNGVLQVTDFATPDPYSYFYSKKALGVSSYDIYPLLFPELKSRLSSTGGDQDNTKRTNPMPAKRFTIMSYWSGIKQADGNGEVNFEFDIPQFSGEIRLMAVSHKNENFGSKDAAMTVADPIVISTALPRFLSPKDTVAVAVTLTNSTSKTSTVLLHLKTSGAIIIAGNEQQEVNLRPNSETRALFRLVAQSMIGLGKLQVEVDGLGEKFTDETEISVRPPSSLQKNTGSGSITGGDKQHLQLNTSDFIPSSSEYKLMVSRSPAIELTKYLSWLIQYPYGCTEQAVSAAFPQLYYGDLADQLHLNKSATASANFNVQEAIRKIKMRQLYSGAITLWDNEGSENWWATIYAAHFLLEAQKAGYDVDKNLIETILGYINNRLRKRETITYYYNRDQNKKIAPKEVAYGLYVLALAGHPNASAMNYYKSNPALLSLDCKYLLSAAFAQAGDQNSFRQFLPSQFAGEESVAQTGGSFYSDIRDESIALNVLIDADPANAQIPIMARHVSDKLKKRDWFSTQEISFSFLALGKLARQAAKSNATAEIQVNGKPIASFTGNDLHLNAVQLKGTNLDILTHGTGRLYYNWEAEGISSTGNYKEEDNYLKIRKRFYDRFGRPLSGLTFKQNDLIIVQLTLEKSYSTDIDNVVITDLLPAGFEIENPRTKEIPGMEWIKDGASPTAMDIRDDRISLFVDADYNKQVYYYAVRAISPGIYRMGPVSADAMYNGEYHSYNGSAMVRIIP